MWDKRVSLTKLEIPHPKGAGNEIMIANMRFKGK